MWVLFSTTFSSDYRDGVSQDEIFRLSSRLLPLRGVRSEFTLVIREGTVELELQIGCVQSKEGHLKKNGFMTSGAFVTNLNLRAMTLGKEKAEPRCYTTVEALAVYHGLMF